MVIWTPGEGPEYGKSTETVEEVEEDEAGAVGFSVFVLFTLPYKAMAQKGSMLQNVSSLIPGYELSGK